MTVSQLLLEQPEFAGNPEPYMQAHLDSAAAELDAEVWGDKFDQGVKFWACHKMALSPMGLAAKLIDSKGNSTYLVHWTMLAASVSSGFRVAVGAPGAGGLAGYGFGLGDCGCGGWLL